LADITSTHDDPDFVVRKLGQTCTVSIKSEWVNEILAQEEEEAEEKTSEKLEKREVKLFRRPDSVVVFFKDSIPNIPKTIIIETEKSESEETIVRKVISAYLAGCMNIAVLVDDHIPTTQKQIKERLEKLTHNSLANTEFKYAEFEIEKASGIKVKELLPQVSVILNDSINIKELLKKMAKDILNTNRAVFQAIEDGKVDYAELLFKSDSNIDRDYLSVLRALKFAVTNELEMKKMGIQNSRECIGIRAIVTNIERTADHTARIARAFCNLVQNDDATTNDKKFKEFKSKVILKKTVWEQIKELNETAIKGFSESIQALVDREYGKADKIVQDFQDSEEDILSKALKLMKKINGEELNSEEVCMLTQLVESIKRIAEYGRGNAEITLNIIVYDVLVKAKSPRELTSLSSKVELKEIDPKVLEKAKISQTK
jgi:phosphate uptake regulator